MLKYTDVKVPDGAALYPRKHRPTTKFKTILNIILITTKPSAESPVTQTVINTSGFQHVM